jgi:chromosome segregation ATPase
LLAALPAATVQVPQAQQADVALADVRARWEESQRTLREAESQLSTAEQRLREAEEAAREARSQRERAREAAETVAAELSRAERRHHRT